MISSTDGSDVTSGTTTVYTTIDGGAQDAGVAATHEGSGCWSYAPSQALTNGDHISYTFVNTSAISVTVNVYPVSFDYTDAVRIGLTALPNAVVDGAGGLATSAGGATGIDDLATSAAQTTAQNDLDIITGAAGVIIDDSAANDTTISDAVWDETLTTSNHNLANSAGKQLRQVDAAFVVTEGTADAGGANTIDLETGVADGTTNDIYAGDRVMITGGTGVGEHGIVISYEAVTNQRCTMAENWVVQPDATSEYILVPADADVETWQHNVVTASAGGLPDVNVNEVGDTAQTAGDLAALITTVDTVVDGIQTDLDNGTDGLGAIKAETALILEDTGTTLPATLALIPQSGGTTSWNATALAAINAEADTALTDYDPPTKAELDVLGTAALATAASLATAQTDLDTISDGIITGTAVTGTLSTTVCTSDLTGYTDDQLIGRIITFLAGPADGESSDITDYASASGTITFTALTLAPENTNAFKIT
jgi:hypothetical protein